MRKTNELHLNVSVKVKFAKLSNLLKAYVQCYVNVTGKKKTGHNLFHSQKVGQFRALCTPHPPIVCIGKNIFSLSYMQLCDCPPPPLATSDDDDDER